MRVRSSMVRAVVLYTTGWGFESLRTHSKSSRMRPEGLEWEGVGRFLGVKIASKLADFEEHYSCRFTVAEILKPRGFKERVNASDVRFPSGRICISY